MIVEKSHKVDYIKKIGAMNANMGSDFYSPKLNLLILGTKDESIITTLFRMSCIHTHTVFTLDIELSGFANYLNCFLNLVYCYCLNQVL